MNWTTFVGQFPWVIWSTIYLSHLFVAIHTCDTCVQWARNQAVLLFGNFKSIRKPNVMYARVETTLDVITILPLHHRFPSEQNIPFFSVHFSFMVAKFNDPFVMREQFRYVCWLNALVHFGSQSDSIEYGDRLPLVIGMVTVFQTKKAKQRASASDRHFGLSWMLHFVVSVVRVVVVVHEFICISHFNYNKLDFEWNYWRVWAYFFSSWRKGS